MRIPSGRRGLRMSQLGDVKRVPAGAVNPAARETVTAGVPCTPVYPASVEAAERAGMALTTRLATCYTGAVTVQSDWRFVTGGVDYRIRAAAAWPVGQVEVTELLLEREG